MNNWLEKVFNHWTFLFFNILIIILVQMTGMYFMDTGLIHLIALVFIGLGISRIVVHYDVYDQYLKPLLHGGILTLLIFALSHVLEYVSYAIFNISYDVIAVNVVNLYLAGILVVCISVELFLGRLRKSFSLFIPVIHLGIIVLLVLTIFTFINGELFSLSPSGWGMYVYLGLISLITFICMSLFFQLRQRVAILVNFLNYFITSFLLIVGSAMLYVLNELLVEKGVPYFRMMYLSHFLFYGALSLMFLAYVRLAKLGGLYDEIKSN